MKIRFSHVSFSYNRKDNNALDDINLEFNKEEIVFIMGHTGSGKSTLVQHINGLLVANEGSVNVEFGEQKFVLGKNIKEKKINELRKNVGLLFQFSEYQLFETSVLKDVMFGPNNFYKDKEKAKEKAKDKGKTTETTDDKKEVKKDYQLDRAIDILKAIAVYQEK